METLGALYFTIQSPLRQEDLIIVGAGFAGLECARAAAVRGVKTLVLERKARARARERLEWRPSGLCTLQYKVHCDRKT